MPLQKLQFKPGVSRESTSYANEGGWFESDKVRFRSGYAEKIGGWTNLAASVNGVAYTYYGVNRVMVNWITLAYANINGIGTNQKFYIENGGKYYDITPLTTASPVTLGANPFATTSGSYLVTVTAAGHVTSPGTWVTFAGATAVGGLTLNGEYEVISTPTGNTYTIISSTAASSTTTGGGSGVTASYQINAGSATYSISNGWGTGAWNGAYGWGSASPDANGIGTQLRLWSADNFGQDLIFAPRGGAIYYWAADTTTIPTPRGITLKKAAQDAGYTDYAFIPNSTLCLISSDVQRFVIAFGANPYDPSDSNTAFDPMLVRWSDQEDPYMWFQDITNQARDYRLQGGSTIVTARTEKQEILIWTDSALFSMQYLGPPYVWGFNQLMGNTSIISPNAIASVNNQTFWMGVDKFYVYNGRVDTLPCTLWQHVFNNINQNQGYQIVSGTNERYSEVWWMYPSLGSPVNDRYVVYNHLEQIWYYGTINRTAWLDSSLRPYPMGAFSVQNTYLDQQINAAQDSITVINGYSYPAAGTLKIDSEYITYTDHTQADGNTIKNCVRGVNDPVTNATSTAATHAQYSAVTYNTPNQVMYHENGTDDNSLSVPQAIEAYVQSSDFDIGDGHNFGFVNRMLPDVTFDGSTVAAPQLTISVRPRRNSGTNYGIGNSPAVISGNDYADPLTHNYVVQLFTGQVYTRIRGRQMAFKVSSTDIGVAWQLGATRIDIRPDGKR